MNKKLISIFVSSVILTVLYFQIDINDIIEVFLRSKLSLAVLGLGMLIPITMLTAYRLVWISSLGNQLSYIESIKLILAASSMNIILPSKMGDIAKSVFIAKEDKMTSSQSLCLVIFEKISDLLAILLWCLFGLIFYQKNYEFSLLFIFVVLALAIGILMIVSTFFSRIFFKIICIVLPINLEKKIHRFSFEWNKLIKYLNIHTNKFIGVIVFSIFLWFLHLLQIWLFILALNGEVSFIHNLALTPKAILIGLLPFTIAGIGTRDAAFIFIYSNYFSAATGAALGLFATMRYMIPAIFGLPFLSFYMRDLLTKSDLD
jgi:glycosyltransferase 2 family protein